MPNASTHGWSSEHDAEVIRLHESGLPYSAIGLAVGKSLSAVSGRLRRLGHAKPRTFLTPEERQRRKRLWNLNYKRKASTGGRRPFVASDVLSVEPRHLSLLDLERGDCRYPYGEGPFTFCGHPCIEGSSYCRSHKFLCSEPPRIPIRRFVGAAA